MTPEQINETIAQLCAGLPYHEPTPEEIASGSYCEYQLNYFDDLNACYEMENMIQGARNWSQYCDSLASVCSHGDDVPVTVIVKATAPQRCEAFLSFNGIKLKNQMKLKPQTVAAARSSAHRIVRQKCPSCYGAGEVTHWDNEDIPATHLVTEKCPRCKGKGGKK